MDANVSPGILKKMVYAGANAASFARAEKDLEELAEAEISMARVRRATERIGQERVQQRDEQVKAWQQLSIPDRRRSPSEDVTVPDVACVESDGGRLQIMDQDPAQDAAEESEAASKEDSKKTHWRESKVGVCLSMTSKVSEEDPCPTIPDTFVDPARMSRLAREIKNAGKKPSETSGPNSRQAQEESQQFEAALEVIEAEKKQAFKYEAPKITERTVVATRQNIKVFGPILAATAWSLGFAAAARKAFVGDGSDTNWSVWRSHFSRFTPILDFVHAICYVYQAAVVGLPPDKAWEIYCQWAQWVWSGQVSRVIEALQLLQQDLGTPEPDDGDTHPRKILATALGYLTNQKGRMKYDKYRKQGLPITSSHIESTIKQINRRVKGTEKFWNNFGAEALLQLAADYVSDTQPLQKFWEDREASSTGQRSYRSAL